MKFCPEPKAFLLANTSFFIDYRQTALKLRECCISVWIFKHNSATTYNAKIVQSKTYPCSAGTNATTQSKIQLKHQPQCATSNVATPRAKPTPAANACCRVSIQKRIGERFAGERRNRPWLPVPRRYQCNIAQLLYELSKIQRQRRITKPTAPTPTARLPGNHPCGKDASIACCSCASRSSMRCRSCASSSRSVSRS